MHVHTQAQNVLHHAEGPKSAQRLAFHKYLGQHLANINFRTMNKMNSRLRVTNLLNRGHMLTVDKNRAEG